MRGWFISSSLNQSWFTFTYIEQVGVLGLLYNTYIIEDFIGCIIHLDQPMRVTVASLLHLILS